MIRIPFYNVSNLEENIYIFGIRMPICLMKKKGSQEECVGIVFIYLFKSNEKENEVLFLI